MLGFNIQTLNIQPRDTSSRDPRLAKTDESRLSRGSDGILYKQIPTKDWGRYKISTAQDEADDLSRTEEIKANIAAMRGKSRVSGGRTTTFTPPMFGSTSRSKQIESKKWETQKSKASKGDEKGLSSTMSRLAENTNTSKEKNTDRQTEAQGQAPPSEAPPYKAVPIPRPQEAGEDLLETANTIFKQKYEQNLQVVQQLFSEKMEMEERMQQMEEKLRTLMENQTSGPQNPPAAFTSKESSLNVRPSTKVANIALKASEYEPPETLYAPKPSSFGTRDIGTIVHKGASELDLADEIETAAVPLPLSLSPSVEEELGLRTFPNEAGGVTAGECILHTLTLTHIHIR
jgi:hypothetical protein